MEAQQGGDRREELAPILGLHFDRAGDAERAAVYLEMAGRQALRRRASAEALELLDRAAAVLQDAPETPAYRPPAGTSMPIAAAAAACRASKVNSVTGPGRRDAAARWSASRVRTR